MVAVQQAIFGSAVRFVAPSVSEERSSGLQGSLLEYIKQLSQKVSSYQVTLMENCFKQLQAISA